MNKYIDAEKLIAEIQRLKKQDITMRERSILIDIEIAIESLQQEQPEVELEAEIEWEWHHREKAEVDCLECAEMDKDEFTRFARHFFELGLNARKEK